MPRGRVLLLGLLAAALSACGDDPAGEGPGGVVVLVAPPPARTQPGTGEVIVPAAPPLARTPLKTGEVVVRGASSGSVEELELDGRYLVRFEQFAPDRPKLDFSSRTPFAASLRPAGARGRSVRVFSAAAPSGRAELTRHGTYVLDLRSGGFPYAVRFTPVR